MAQAKMSFTILEDGTITCKTDGIPGEHHRSADEFLAEVETLAGTQRVTVSKGPRMHHHTHDHEHAHEGHGHTH